MGTPAQSKGQIRRFNRFHLHLHPHPHRRLATTDYYYSDYYMHYSMQILWSQKEQS